MNDSHQEELCRKTLRQSPHPLRRDFYAWVWWPALQIHPRENQGSACTGVLSLKGSGEDAKHGWWFCCLPICTFKKTLLKEDAQCFSRKSVLYACSRLCAELSVTANSGPRAGGTDWPLLYPAAGLVSRKADVPSSQRRPPQGDSPWNFKLQSS